MQANADEAKTVKVGCGTKRAQELRKALIKTAPFGQPVTVHLAEGCTYTYPGNKKYFSVPSGRTIIGHGATLRGRTKDQAVLRPLTSTARITLQDLTLAGPARCVRVPVGSHFTFKNVKMHCSDAHMTVEKDATVDLLGDTELRGTGKAVSWRSEGGGLVISRGATVHMRDQAKITNWAVSTSMIDHPAGGGTESEAGKYATTTTYTPYRAAHSSHVGGTGAGVWNQGTLTVEDQAKITGNKIVRTTQQPKYPLDADPWDTYKGGGIYNTEGAKATVVPGSVTGNQPDQCAGPAPVTGCTN
ncbi:hypothetical protein [Streptomyces sp. NPDC096013]|uniref:hypothetical protein n=1 Tax=Streptomyces sp. NPDC096013 TaxID=3366069 RepID=UPI003808B283